MVNCKFIKRDARGDSDSYGKCGMGIFVLVYSCKQAHITELWERL